MPFGTPPTKVAVPSTLECTGVSSQVAKNDLPLDDCTMANLSGGNLRFNSTTLMLLPCVSKKMEISKVEPTKTVSILGENKSAALPLTAWAERCSWKLKNKTRLKTSKNTIGAALLCFL